MADELRLRVGLDPADVRQFVDVLRATPRQVRLASARSLRATLRTGQARVARVLSASSDLPVGVFKKSVSNAGGYRVRPSRVDNDSTHGSIWVGTQMVKARYIGKARATKRGIVVGSGRFRRFYEHEGDNRVRLVERSDGRPSILFLNKRKRWEAIKEPVIARPLDGVARELKTVMAKNMRAQLNFLLNHARGRYQRTGRRGRG